MPISIMPFILFLLICFTGLLFSVLPAYFVYAREKRLYKLALARHDITRAVSEMQETFLDGTIGRSHVCQDELFEVMCFAQGSNDYIIRFPPWKEPSQESKEFAARVEKDLADGTSACAQALTRFTKAYRRAFKYKHPLLFARTNISLFFTGAFIKLLLQGLQFARKRAFLLKETNKEVCRLRENELRTLILRETYNQVNPTFNTRAA